MINLNKQLKILYVHGFNGHENSNSAQLLRKVLKQRNINAIVDAPAIPFLEPSKAIELVTNASGYDLIVASSLGAFYSLNNVGTPKILVNIAMPSDLLKIIPDIDKNYINELNTSLTHFINRCDRSRIKYETNFIFGTKDDIAQNKQFVIDNLKCFNDNNITEIDMTHHLDENGVNAVCDLIIKLSLCGNRHLQIYEELIYEED